MVDALDAAAVDGYLETVVRRAGGIDVELDATGPRIGGYGHGKPVVDLTVEEFMTPAATVLRSQFTTAQAAARRMVAQGSGVIIFLTAAPARAPLPGSSGIGAAYGAVETVMRTMAAELGPAGVRAVCLRTTANPDTRSIQDATVLRAEMMDITPEQAMARLADATMLKVLPHAADTARAAAFLASDRAEHDDRHRPQPVGRSGHGLRTRGDGPEGTPRGSHVLRGGLGLPVGAVEARAQAAAELLLGLPHRSGQLRQLGPAEQHEDDGEHEHEFSGSEVHAGDSARPGPPDGLPRPPGAIATTPLASAASARRSS